MQKVFHSARSMFPSSDTSASPLMSSENCARLFSMMLCVAASSASRKLSLGFSAALPPLDGL